MQGIRKTAESLASGTEKAAAGFSSQKDDASMPSDKAAQVADLLKSVRAVLSEIAAGPEPAPEPQKSEKPGETLPRASGKGIRSRSATPEGSLATCVPLLMHFLTAAPHLLIQEAEGRSRALRLASGTQLVGK